MDSFEDLWTYSGMRLRAILARGDNVVIHCRGGLGRTGTVAARLLVEFGDQQETAIWKVRQRGRARSKRRLKRSTSRTASQWLGPVSCGPTRGRVLACLLGGAMCDAFGYEVKFNSLEKIQQWFGPAGIKVPVLSSQTTPR